MICAIHAKRLAQHINHILRELEQIFVQIEIAQQSHKLGLLGQHRFRDWSDPGGEHQVDGVVDHFAGNEDRIGVSGHARYLEYDCGSGQTFPGDPMIGVVMPDGTIEEFWFEELEAGERLDPSRLP